MDKDILVVLASDVEAHMTLIDEIYGKIDLRAADLDAGDAVRLESAAYQLHNLYNAIEDLLTLVATAFENQIADTSSWHIRPLRRMTHSIRGVRPALLSEETYALLDGLRSFRQFFRHAYAASIDYESGSSGELERPCRIRPPNHRSSAHPSHGSAESDVGYRNPTYIRAVVVGLAGLPCQSPLVHVE